jgi:hypothetical protein
MRRLTRPWLDANDRPGTRAAPARPEAGQAVAPVLNFGGRHRPRTGPHVYRTACAQEAHGQGVHMHQCTGGAGRNAHATVMIMTAL